MDAFILAFFPVSQAGEKTSPVSLLFIEETKAERAFTVFFAKYFLQKKHKSRSFLYKVSLYLLSHSASQTVLA